MPTVVISPYNVVNFPEGGGHFWVYLQYALGMRRVGCEVWWLEAFQPSGDEAADLARVELFRSKLERFGLGERLIVYPTDGTPNAELPQRYVGRERADVEAIFAGADLLLSFHYAIAPALLARFRRTALVDIDPGLLQFWISRGQLSVPRHDLYFTTGDTVGRPGSRIPDCGIEWLRIRPPVSLESWPFSYQPEAEAFTTISLWDSKDWIVDDDDSYENTKRSSFLEFAMLPRLTRQPVELALYLKTEKDAQERSALERLGWRIRNSPEVAGTPEQYQAYIQGSRGEFSCAKRSCMKFQNAWISDRTLCYLASGKPAVVQDTGPSSFLPDDGGLFRVSTAAQAAEAFAAINEDYRKHCRKARFIAERFFDSKQIALEILAHGLQ
ncbi:MAG TPA: hypothetical protein VF384_16435 [Planctomycetota bacterium]